MSEVKLTDPRIIELFSAACEQAEHVGGFSGQRLRMCFEQAAALLQDELNKAAQDGAD